jgi:hypothetical protein
MVLVRKTLKGLFIHKMTDAYQVSDHGYREHTPRVWGFKAFRYESISDRKKTTYPNTTLPSYGIAAIARNVGDAIKMIDGYTGEAAY